MSTVLTSSWLCRADGNSEYQTSYQGQQPGVTHFPGEAGEKKGEGRIISDRHTHRFLD